VKFWGIFRFEFAYQVRRGWPWLFFAVVLVISFLMTRDAAVADAVFDDFFVNSPFSIAITTVVGGLLWLLVAAVVAGEAAARDVATGMHPLVYTVPISKTEYLGGRFLAALVLNAVILLAVQAGALLAIYSPGVNAELIGPFRPAAYLTAYAYIALPNAFFATALQFLLATRSGRPMASYVGSLLLIFMGFFVASLLLYRRGLGILVDPIGIRFIVEDIAHLWTTTEKSWRLLAFEGIVLRNRLVWLGVGLVAVAVTYLSFRFAHRTESSTRWMRWKRRRDAGRYGDVSGDMGIADLRIAVSHLHISHGFAVQARKMLAIAWTSFRAIARSWPGFALLVVIPLMMVIAVLDSMVIGSVPLIPTTARVIGEMTAPLSDEMARWVIIPLLIVFLAGELVWREREAGLGEITDSMPGSDWAPFLGKFLGLGLVLVLFMTILAAAGMVAQALRGYHNFEIGLYLKVLLGLQLPEYLLFAVLALVAHVLVDQKYVGHLVTIVAYVYIVVLANMLGIEHNMLVYGAGPRWSYTEMLGFGASIGPWLWFKLYWAAWALLLAMVARLLWVRGKEKALHVRIQQARRRLTGPTAGIGVVAALLVLMLAGFTFYNTNVLNEYLSTDDVNERRAEYERRYRRYEGIPQPHLTGTSLRVEIHPERRAVDIRGSYRLVNSGKQPIDSIHVATAMGVDTRAVTFDRAAKLAVDDDEHGYRIYSFERPLQPGDALRLDFDVHVERRGFRNRGIDPSVVANGSSFTSSAWFPFIGYQRMREILPPAQRRKHGLEPRPILASLYEVEGREPATRGGGIAFEAVVGTGADQVAVAPGALRRTWTESGRRYFHYSTDAPIGSEWAFFSANYAVREGQWNDVAIRIFHHPEHTGHLDRMMRGAQASLDYYSREFGPYPYRHLNIVEQPGAPGTGAHAEPSMISYGEGWAYWIPKDEKRLDFPSWVMAHEIAHQWTLPYALVEGLPFLSEGLASFSAIQVVKESRGVDQVRRLLSVMRQPHPYREIRRGEPLLRALDPYLAYRRGPFAMYALTQYVGSDQVNGAIRRLIEKHDAPGAPQATTMHLYRELQAVTPDSLKFLLHDLFEVNTYWRLKTERATAKEIEGGWQLTLALRARKEVFDSAGFETEVPMDEWLEIGVFAEAAEGSWELSQPIYVRKHRIRSGEQTITVTVPRKPVLAGIDPFHVLDWEEREDDDNIAGVEIKR
jgi:ABC-2 type transport system permease protein